MDVLAAASAPPRLPFVLSIGVTGHRSEALPGTLAGLRERIRGALQLIADTAEQVRARESGWFATDPTRLLLISPLADGADQLVANEAMGLGYSLHALLPFGRDEYRNELVDEASRRDFDALLGSAERVLELPGARGREAEAYAMTGRATVSHCDLLLAVWDGLAARGQGGTGEVVEQAIRRGTPVLHIPVDGTGAGRLLWSAFDPSVITEAEDEMVQRPFDSAHLDRMFTALLLPPTDPQERRFLERFARERGRRIRARIEYPLLLAAAGVARFRPAQLSEARCIAAIHEEWRQYREACLGSQTPDPSLDLLETAYSWSDRLATHFAQTYRGGHVFNFTLGGIAVCMGLSTFILPGAKVTMAAAEFVITLAIIVNTRVGLRHEWHRRWLDYRQLAERLRPMRSLKLLGLAAPAPPGSIANPVPNRWIDWYASGLWRAMGCPRGAIDDRRSAEAAKAVATFEIAPQVTYHEGNSRQIAKLDRRLERIAALLFGATLIACVFVAFAQPFAPRWVAQYNNWLTLVSAGFPALGTAIFGIRFQGDFGGSAIRSQTTANALRQICEELLRSVSLARASDLAEQAARIMLVDLDEWRLVNQQQDLGLG